MHFARSGWHASLPHRTRMGVFVRCVVPGQRWWLDAACAVPAQNCGGEQLGENVVSWIRSGGAELANSGKERRRGPCPFRGAKPPSLASMPLLECKLRAKGWPRSHASGGTSASRSYIKTY